jgi:DNA-binding HxlR family transcriptional regulator
VLREILGRIGDKWSLLVIGTLHFGPLRSGDLLAHIPGISQRMLTVTLRHLERDGIVTRTSHPEVPPRVEYELTAIGRGLAGPAGAVAGWAIDNVAEIQDARSRFDAQHPA